MRRQVTGKRLPCACLCARACARLERRWWVYNNGGRTPTPPGRVFSISTPRSVGRPPPAVFDKPGSIKYLFTITLTETLQPEPRPTYWSYTLLRVLFSFLVFRPSLTFRPEISLRSSTPSDEVSGRRFIYSLN